MAITVKQWLREHPGHSLVVQESTSLEALLQAINEQPDVQDLYVVDGQGVVVGHISKLRVANLVLAQHQRSHSRRQIFERVSTGNAGELMERHFPTATPDEDLDSVIHRLLEHQIQDLAVLDEMGGLAGTISVTALLRSFT